LRAIQIFTSPGLHPRPQLREPVAQVEAVGDQQLRRHRRHPEDGAELGGGELGHPRGAVTAAADQPFPAGGGPVWAFQHAAQVGPLGGQRQLLGLGQVDRQLPGLRPVQHLIGIQRVDSGCPGAHDGSTAANRSDTGLGPAAERQGVPSTTPPNCWDSGGPHPPACRPARGPKAAVEHVNESTRPHRQNLIPNPVIHKAKQKFFAAPLGSFGAEVSTSYSQPTGGMLL
jgi:hypothetical protein